MTKLTVDHHTTTTPKTIRIRKVSPRNATSYQCGPLLARCSDLFREGRVSSGRESAEPPPLYLQYCNRSAKQSAVTCQVNV